MPTPGDSRRREGGAIALAAASLLSGVFAYVYIALGTREYGADDFAGVAQLWTIWFFGSSVLTFPLQHWVIQRLRTDGHGGAVRAVLPRLALITLGIAAGTALVAALAHEDLFGSGDPVYPLTAAAIVVGCAGMGLLRGGLAGRSRFLAAASVLGGENGVRLAAGALVVVAGGSAAAYGLALVTGLLMVVPWPGALRFEGPSTGHVSPLAFLGNVAGGTIIAQFVLTGGPVVLGLTGGSRAEVTSLFTALALFRAPYVVALGLGIRVTAHLTDLAATHRWDELDAARRRMALGGIAVMVAGGAGAAVLGRPVLQVVFGDQVDLTSLEFAGLAAGSLAALATLGLTLVHMTHGAGGLVLRAWVAGLVLGTVGLVALPLDPLPRVVAAFLVAELAAFALLARHDARAGRA